MEMKEYLQWEDKLSERKLKEYNQLRYPHGSLRNY